MTDQILQRSPKEQLNDFLHGQADCKAGKPHEAGRSEHYDRGYSAQYTLEQILTEQAPHDSRSNRTKKYL